MEEGPIEEHYLLLTHPEPTLFPSSVPRNVIKKHREICSDRREDGAESVRELMKKNEELWRDWNALWKRLGEGEQTGSDDVQDEDIPFLLLHLFRA
jgi:hypothetical protein